jgi:hypothetical protein
VKPLRILKDGIDLIKFCVFHCFLAQIEVKIISRKNYFFDFVERPQALTMSCKKIFSRKIGNKAGLATNYQFLLEQPPNLTIACPFFLVICGENLASSMCLS